MTIAKPVRYNADDCSIRDANDCLVATIRGGLIYPELFANEIVTTLNRELESPLDMVLWCPKCFEQHVDEAAPEICEDCGLDEDLCTASGSCSFNPWLNPPHKSHRCNFCNYVWRPADGCTNGVLALKTTKATDGSAKPCSFGSRKDFDEAVAIASGRQPDKAHGENND